MTTRKSVPKSPAKQAAAPTTKTATIARRKPSVAKPAIKIEVPVQVVGPKTAKPKKVEAKAAKIRPRLVRDGFTMPEADFSLIGTLKARALGAAHPAKKSELLRAGLQALAALDTPTLVAALARLEPVKTGRPRKAG